MAGDWIKIETTLHTKPETLALSESLALSSDEVVGKLVRVWTWTNQHLKTGFAKGVKLSFLDTLTGSSAFGKNLEKVGWVKEREDGLFFPNFERHNSKSAKQRALNAARMCKKRADSNRTKSAQKPHQRREEKRREDIKENPPTPHRGNGAVVAADSLPFIPDPPKFDRAAAFDRFWKAYPSECPRKKEKEKCFEKFCAAVKGWKNPDAMLGILLERLEEDKASRDWQKDGGEFIKAPLVWLNGRRWGDEPAVHLENSSRLENATSVYFHCPPCARDYEEIDLYADRKRDGRKVCPDCGGEVHEVKT